MVESTDYVTNLFLRRNSPLTLSRRERQRTSSEKHTLSPSNAAAEPNPPIIQLGPEIWLARMNLISSIGAAVQRYIKPHNSL